jgi:M6 family metalloprotease-like protein
MIRVARIAAILLVLGGAGAWNASAQDIEAQARARGLTLPTGYYEQVRDNPGFFEISAGWIARGELARTTGVPLGGRLPLAVVQILFSDSPEPHVQIPEIQRALFDGPAPHGTLSDYYREVSRGRLEVTGEVFPWVRIRVSLSDAVGSNYGLGRDARVGVALWQALEAVDSLIDFGLFDNDGPDGIPNSGDDDGYVDAVAFQFTEIAASCGGAGVWPHRATISHWMGRPFQSRARRPNGQPILVNDYIIQSTVVCSGTRVQTAAVIAHELGHVLGLPDLYDATGGILPSQRRWVIGCWGLMAAGAWGCGEPGPSDDELMPTHMIPWSKQRLGWISPRVAGSVLGEEFVLRPVQTSGDVLQIPISHSAHLHVEYRPRQGFDRDLPASGIVIYHVDTAKPLLPCASCPREYQVSILEADGNDSLIRSFQQGGNRGEAGDAWGWNALGRLDNGTHPSTRRLGGVPSDVAIYDVRIENGEARMRISTRTLPRERLLRSFLGSPGEGLTAEEEAYLDAAGNRNGTVDIGDVRAYLRAQPNS